LIPFSVLLKNKESGGVVMPKSQEKEIVKGMKVKDNHYGRICEVFIVAPDEDGEVGVISGNNVGVFKKKYFWENFTEVMS
jgi:hypothetical protein